MTDYQINDKWILDRVSSQSSSFSGWMTDLLKVVEQLNPEVYEDIKKDKDFSNTKRIRQKIFIKNCKKFRRKIHPKFTKR